MAKTYADDNDGRPPTHADAADDAGPPGSIARTMMSHYQRSCWDQGNFVHPSFHWSDVEPQDDSY